MTIPGKSFKFNYKKTDWKGKKAGNLKGTITFTLEETPDDAWKNYFEKYLIFKGDFSCNVSECLRLLIPRDNPREMSEVYFTGELHYKPLKKLDSSVKGKLGESPTVLNVICYRNWNREEKKPLPGYYAHLKSTLNNDVLVGVVVDLE